MAVFNWQFKESRRGRQFKKATIQILLGYELIHECMYNKKYFFWMDFDCSESFRLVGRTWYGRRTTTGAWPRSSRNGRPRTRATLSTMCITRTSTGGWACHLMNVPVNIIRYITSAISGKQALFTADLHLFSDVRTLWIGQVEHPIELSVCIRWVLF